MTQVQDPISPVDKTNPTERDNKTVPLEVKWEKEFEQEKSLSDEKSEAVAEAQRILFPSTGSISNEYKPEIQVEDKPVTKEEMNNSNFLNYDLFFKPLESAVNIAGSVMSETTAVASAGVSLLTENIMDFNKDKKPASNEDFQKQQEQAFHTQNYMSELKKAPVLKPKAVEVGDKVVSMDEVLMLYGIDTSFGGLTKSNGELRIDVENAVIKAESEAKKDQLKESKDMQIASATNSKIMLGAFEGGTAGGAHIMSTTGGGE